MEFAREQLEQFVEAVAAEASITNTPSANAKWATAAIGTNVRCLSLWGEPSRIISMVKGVFDYQLPILKIATDDQF